MKNCKMVFIVLYMYYKCTPVGLSFISAGAGTTLTLLGGIFFNEPLGLPLGGPFGGVPRAGGGIFFNGPLGLPLGGPFGGPFGEPFGGPFGGGRPFG